MSLSGELFTCVAQEWDFCLCGSMVEFLPLYLSDEIFTYVESLPVYLYDGIHTYVSQY